MLSEYGDDSQWAIKTTGWCDNVSIVTDWWKNRRKFQARFAMARKTRFLYHVFNSIKNSHFPRLKISFYATCAKRHCAQPRVKNSYAIHRLVEQTFLYNMALKTLRNCVRKLRNLRPFDLNDLFILWRYLLIKEGIFSALSAGSFGCISALQSVGSTLRRWRRFCRPGVHDWNKHGVAKTFSIPLVQSNIMCRSGLIVRSVKLFAIGLALTCQ